MIPNSSRCFKNVATLLLLCAFVVQSVWASQESLKSKEQEPEAKLIADAQKVSEGFITLRWSGLDDDSVVTMQVASDAGGNQIVRTLRLKGQSQVHLSGFADGVYYARLMDASGSALTNSTRFEVRHRALKTASMLFAIGAGLFVFLVVTLYRFARSDP